ncbi:MAG: 2-isopropylmalate synthase [Candidatus Bathyarchaeota archaeon]|nr:2-isopropylmalate synthase [Candidatus Bathyarchaeota archaeon]
MSDVKWGIALLDPNCFPKKIKILDTTLRDGEQTPGVSLTPENKLRIAKRLDELGVDIIEAGFAAVSQGELEAVKLIAEAGLKAEICSCSRVTIGDIDAVSKAEADSIHLVIPTSDLHIEWKLKKTRDQMLQVTQKCVKHAKDVGLVVELSAEDATRSDKDYLKKVFRTGIDAGADRVVACDTVGVLTPEKAYEFYGDLVQSLSVPVSVHCHNDFGMAVANSVSALRAGCSEVHCTINGLGERAGNASLEEIVVALKSLYNIDVGLKTELLYSTSQLVSRLSGIMVQPNKAIVGENAFTHESGIHTQGLLENPSTYESIDPSMVGVTRRISPGKHSGTHAIKASVEAMGIHPTDEQLREIWQRVKVVGDKGKTVSDADLLAIAEAVTGLEKPKAIQLQEVTVVSGNTVTPTASVRLKVNENDITEAAIGVGPVDAVINAVKKAVLATEPVTLEQYHVKSITGGTDAMVEVVVRMRKDTKTATATGVREDIVMASMDAVLAGMNVLTALNGNGTTKKTEKQ